MMNGSRPPTIRQQAHGTAREGRTVNPSELIDKVIADLPDWRGKAMADIRRVVHEAEADVIEEWKWMGTPVWSHNGLVCAADAHKNIVKMIFFKGASLADPEHLFN